MATIRTAIQLQDGLSPVIRGMNNALNIVISSFEQMQRASGSSIDTNSIQEARRELASAEASFNQVEDSIRNSNSEQQRFNNSVKNGHSAADGLANKIGNVVKAYLGFQAIKGIADTSDQFVQTKARLDMMNDGLQTTEQLQNVIYQSAQRSRAVYADTANAVAQLGIRAKDAFSSNQEVVAFSETLNKMFTIAGASQEEMSSATLQLTQALGSGVLRGEEFNAVFEAAPNVMQAVADYMGKPIGQLRNMASEGQISADIVKKALFAAADETNTKFNNMPKTIGQIWTSIKNQALMSFQPVLLKINELANNPNFTNFVNMMVGGFAMISIAALDIINSVSNVAAFFQNNWSIIQPIILAIVAALIVYNATMGIAWLTTLKDVAAKVAHTIASWAETAAIIALVIAQDGLNAALAMCPLTWIIIAIIVLIAIFYAVIGAINKFAGTSLSATGLIAGAFLAVAAFIGNIIIALINAIIDSFGIVWNFLATFAEFFANFLDDPVGSIIRLFSGLADTVLEILQGIASAIDTIFSSHLADAVSGWRDTLQGWTDDVAGEAKIKVDRIDTSGMHLERFDYGQSFDYGYGKGAAAENWLGNLANPQLPTLDNTTPDYKDLLNNATNNAANNDLAKNAAKAAEGAGKTADNTGAIKNSLDITDEDLKYLRDIAEQESINRFTTAEVKLEMTNHNNINNELDLDKIIDNLGEGLSAGLQIIAEGATYSV